MPFLHIFIVIPVAEREQMVPRTYDTLAALGHQEGMTGQSALITKANEEARLKNEKRPDVVRHANTIVAPNAQLLEGNGLRIVTSMLQTSGSCVDLKGVRRTRYREIYIHSKLMLISDSFFTLGSANMNQRSMAVDSELTWDAMIGRKPKICASGSGIS
jgi:phosphatidylserine/phosphatidylglycerophosphate/cardiolipin synthase-like enzyme